MRPLLFMHLFWAFFWDTRREQIGNPPSMLAHVCYCLKMAKLYHAIAVRP